MAIATQFSRGFVLWGAGYDDGCDLGTSCLGCFGYSVYNPDNFVEVQGIL